MSSRPRIAITVGDPSGIGPEIAVKAREDPRVNAVCEPVLYGPQTADALAAFPVGQIAAASGRAAYEAIVAAVGDAQAGRVDAIATAPVNKESLAAAGLPWRGHTDLLGALTGCPHPVMFFRAPALSVALATVHIPLADVARRLTEGLVASTIRTTWESLPLFGIAAPRLALAGLNPHAGEHGVIGSEDDEVLRPAVERCRAEGIEVTGPHPGDTVFLRASKGEFDAVVACYHDQGLIPIKLLSFGRAVNVTLGLPIIRTSVDHGTAFDIAGRGVADAGSLVEAIELAAALVGARRAMRATVDG